MRKHIVLSEKNYERLKNFTVHGLDSSFENKIKWLLDYAGADLK